MFHDFAIANPYRLDNLRRDHCRTFKKCGVLLKVNAKLSDVQRYPTACIEDIIIIFYFAP